MLNCEPQNLLQEIERAETFRDHHRASVKDLVEGYHGGAFRDDRGSGSEDHENHAYEYISLVLPRIIFDNPRVQVDTALPATQEVIAKAIEHGLNKRVRNVKLRQLLVRIAADMFFGWGVGITTQRPLPGTDPRKSSGPRVPSWDTISTSRFVFDPLCMFFGHARFAGHKWVRDLEDIAKDPSFDAKAVKGLATDAGLDELDRPDSKDGGPTRKEVVGYDIWVPEQYEDVKDHPGPDAGFHGSIYTIAVAQTSDGDEKKTAYIREPRPFYGPARGPYALFGVYPVPDSPFPLSPLKATALQSNELNAHLHAAMNSAKSYKRLALVDAGNPDLVQSIKNQPDTFVVPVRGLAKNQVQVIEVGGASQQQYDYIAMARDRLDRNSGINDAHRGNLDQDTTATAVATAEEALASREAFIKQQFSDAVIQMMEAGAWYLYHDERSVFPLGGEAAKDLDMAEPWFYGGVQPGEEDMRFEDLELQIEPLSMERVNEALLQKRAQDNIELALNAGPIIPETPWVNWSLLFERMGDAQNSRDFDQVIDVEMAQQVHAERQAQEQAEAAMQSGGTGALGNQTGGQLAAAGRVA